MPFSQTLSFSGKVDISNTRSRRVVTEYNGAVITDPNSPVHIQEVEMEKGDSQVISNIQKIVHLLTTKPVNVTISIGVDSITFVVTRSLIITSAIDTLLVEYDPTDETETTVVKIVSN